MLNKILSFTKQLIAIPSTKENPEELKKVLEVAEREIGEGFTVERFESNNTPSLLFYNSPKRPAKFKVILNAHLDVVPAKPEFYTPYEEGEKLYGRGADDMKAAIAGVPGVKDLLVEQQIEIARRKAGILPNEKVDLLCFEVERHH